MGHLFPHHEDHEGHEVSDIYVFKLRALRVLRGEYAVSLLVAASPQCRSRVSVKLEMTPLLVNHHPIVAARRFQRHVTCADIGEHALGVALQRTPETAATGGLDQKPLAGAH